MPGSQQRGSQDEEGHAKVLDVVEALVNALYLIRTEANDPTKIDRYAALAEERLEALVELLRK